LEEAADVSEERQCASAGLLPAVTQKIKIFLDAVIVVVIIIITVIYNN
jgi:hypothetical protein